MGGEEKDKEKDILKAQEPCHFPSLNISLPISLEPQLITLGINAFVSSP